MFRIVLVPYPLYFVCFYSSTVATIKGKTSLPDFNTLNKSSLTIIVINISLMYLYSSVHYNMSSLKFYFDDKRGSKETYCMHINLPLS